LHGDWILARRDAYNVPRMLNLNVSGETALDSLDQRIAKAKARNELAAFDDETAIEEELAALYLCVSPKKLGELRSSGGGPVFIKPQDPKAAGRNQPVSYVMSELRKWRESMSAGSNLEVARRQGLVGWVSGIEPFWANRGGALLGSALDQSAEGWPDMFLEASVRTVDIVWMSPRDALMSRWAKASAHTEFADEYRAALSAERSAILASLERTELNMETPTPQPKSPLQI
jgi:hypothetical protein